MDMRCQSPHRINNQHRRRGSKFQDIPKHISNTLYRFIYQTMQIIMTS